MRCYGFWYGGTSYSADWKEDDLETFRSLREAKGIFRSRLSNDVGYTPCVDSSAELWLFSDRARALAGLRDGTLYPDLLVQVGPRGGVVVTPA